MDSTSWSTLWTHSVGGRSDILTKREINLMELLSWRDSDGLTKLNVNLMNSPNWKSV